MSVELGQYAGTVLAAWGVGLGLLAALIVQTLLQNAAARRALEAEEARLSKDRNDG